MSRSLVKISDPCAFPLKQNNNKSRRVKTIVVLPTVCFVSLKLLNSDPEPLCYIAGFRCGFGHVRQVEIKKGRCHAGNLFLGSRESKEKSTAFVVGHFEDFSQVLSDCN